MMSEVGDDAPVLALSVAVEERPDDHAVVVSVAGDPDRSTAPTLRRILIGMRSSRAPRVVLTLDGVTFLDCSGPGELLAARNQLRVRGGELVLSPPSEYVLRLFEWTGTDGCFPVEQWPCGQRAEVGACR